MPIKSFGSNPATSDTTILVEAPVVATSATVFAKPTSFFFTFIYRIPSKYEEVTVDIPNTLTAAPSPNPWGPEQSTTILFDFTIKSMFGINSSTNSTLEIVFPETLEILILAEVPPVSSLSTTTTSLTA